MKSTHFIESALGADGVLSMKSLLKGKRWFQAKMSWMGEKPVVGKVSLSIGSALESLEVALADDAAKEMAEKGAA